MSSPNKDINRLTKCFSLIICVKEMKITGHTSYFCHSTAKRQQSNRLKNLMFCCHAPSLPLQKRNLQGQTAQEQRQEQRQAENDTHWRGSAGKPNDRQQQQQADSSAAAMPALGSCAGSRQPPRSSAPTWQKRL